MAASCAECSRLDNLSKCVSCEKVRAAFPQVRFCFRCFTESKELKATVLKNKECFYMARKAKKWAHGQQSKSVL
jgi:hypothetical protein